MTKGVSPDESLVGLSVVGWRPGWIPGFVIMGREEKEGGLYIYILYIYHAQCRMGPRMLREGKGASMSRQMTMYVPVAPEKLSSGVDWASWGILSAGLLN